MSALPVDYDRLLDELRTEGQLLVAATHDASPLAPVAGASGRTLLETVRHVGDRCEDCLSWLGVSESAARDWPVTEDAGLPELTGRFTERLADLLGRFGTVPPDQPCATWYPHDRTAKFWLRRMVHTTTVHRVDVQTAAHVEVTPISADIACDGIDEVLRVWFGYRLDALGIRASRAWKVRVTVGNMHWHVRAGSERAQVSQDSSPNEEEPDAVISGNSQAVYLWLWGRLPDRAAETSGDHDVIAQLWGLLRLATR